MSKAKSNKFEFLKTAKAERDNPSEVESELDTNDVEPIITTAVIEAETQPEPEATEIKELIQAKDEIQPEPEPIEQTEPSETVVSQPQTLEQPTSTQVPQANQPKQMGRPKVGKRSNDDFKQVTAYIKKDTYEEVQDALYNEKKKEKREKKREFSELMQELLEGWLQSGQ